jgi:hypothetical protein
MAHEARTDFAMLLGAVSLLSLGSGPWAFDRHLTQRFEAGAVLHRMTGRTSGQAWRVSWEYPVPC